MVVTNTVAIVLLVVFAGASFFFALAETALFSLGKWRATQLKESSPVNGQKLIDLLESPQDLLATIVLGNTVANAGIVATCLWGVMRWNWAEIPAMAGALALILAGCEVAPKTLAVRAPEFWSLRLVGSLFFFRTATRPVREVAQGMNRWLARLLLPKSFQKRRILSDEEYQELLEVAYQQGALGQSEKEIILQIVNLDRQTAGDVMKPRLQMACISDDLSVEEMIAAARKFKHPRLPIYDETPDTIVGILNAEALLLNPDTDLADVIEFPSFVPQTMNLLQLLQSLQRQNRGLAIVLDEFGGTAGAVTMEDILTEVIGEFREDMTSEPVTMQNLGPGRWKMSGTYPLEDFQREYPPLGEVPGVDTMGGLLVRELEVVPNAGESAVFRGLRLTAQAVDERRVREVLAETTKKPGPSRHE